MTEDVLYDLRFKILKDWVITSEDIPNSGKISVIATYHGYKTSCILNTNEVQDLNSIYGIDIESRFTTILMNNLIGSNDFIKHFEKIQRRQKNLDIII